MQVFLSSKHTLLLQAAGGKPLCNVECEERVGPGAAGFLDLFSVLLVRPWGSCVGPALGSGDNSGYVHLLCRILAREQQYKSDV